MSRPTRLSCSATSSRPKQAGFTAGMSSDHFSPWSARQGESGFAWSFFGAALATTNLPFGVVNAPGQRYHPAIIGQAIATLAQMFPGRFWAALGSGEASNERGMARGARGRCNAPVPRHPCANCPATTRPPISPNSRSWLRVNNAPTAPGHAPYRTSTASTCALPSQRPRAVTGHALRRSTPVGRTSHARHRRTPPRNRRLGPKRNEQVTTSHHGSYDAYTTSPLPTVTSPNNLSSNLFRPFQHLSNADADNERTRMATTRATSGT
jgi:hypothetical protein